MLNEEETYTYQGIKFTSKEAMELFIASRVDKYKTPKPPGGSLKTVLMIVGIVWVVALLVDCSRSPRVAPAPEPPAQAQRSMSSDEIKTVLAAMINLHGELCATVTDIRRAHGDVYNVTCTRYRDGTGSATYEVDASTGAVK